MEIAGSASFSRAIGAFLPMSCLPIMNSGGEFVIAWQGPSLQGFHIYAARYNPDGVRQGGEHCVPM